MADASMIVKLLVYLAMSRMSAASTTETPVTSRESSHRISEVPPEFSRPLPDWPDRDYYDDSGPPISLHCHIVSTENTSIYWYKNTSVLLQISGIYDLFDNNQTLTLVLPRQNQTGLYTCLANNTAGNVTHTGYIIIAARHEETRPRVTQTDPSDLVKHVALGASVNISCEFDVGGSETSLMDLSVNWLNNGQQVNDTAHTSWGISTTRTNNQLFSLNIHKLQADDYGHYMCIGLNQIGNDSRVITVKGPLPYQASKLQLILGGSVAGGVTLISIVLVLFLWQRRRMHQKYRELVWPEPDAKGFTVPEEAPQYDVFISYSSEDLTWVKDQLYTHLADNKYNVCIDFKDFVPGQAVCENIIESIYKSQKTIVVWSANFRKSLWGQFELQQAHHRTIIQRKDALVLIRYDDSRVPPKLLGQTFLDWSDEQVRPHFWTRLQEALGEPNHFIEGEETPIELATLDEQNENYKEVPDNVNNEKLFDQIPTSKRDRPHMEEVEEDIGDWDENVFNEVNDCINIKASKQNGVVTDTMRGYIHSEEIQNNGRYIDSTDSGVVTTNEFENDSFVVNRDTEVLVSR